MRDELALAERASKGSRYRELLRSGEVAEALDGIEAQYAADLLDCQSHDERERLWLAVQVVRKVKAHLNQIDSDGKLAAHQLAEIRRLRS
jgi:sulfur transfer protein SufE